MIISDLITQLINIKNKSGDIDVTILDPLYKPEDGQWTGSFDPFTYTVTVDKSDTEIVLLVPHSSFITPEET